MLDDKDFWEDLIQDDTKVQTEQGGAVTDEMQLMQSVLTAVRELTKEVKQIRIQLEDKPYEPVHYPSESPPGLTTVSGDSKAHETKTEVQSVQEEPKKKNKALSIISNLLFYAVIVAMLLGAFLMRSTSKGEPFMIAGYSAANVLTSSMEDVYPKGSLIITKHVDANELKIGDDITFMVSEYSSITHRIIEITENHPDTGERAFKTQGTMNASPDKDMVAAANVVGKVIFHSKALGDIANFVKANWPILIFVLVVIIGLISFLKWNARRVDDDESEAQEETSSENKEQTKETKNTESEEEAPVKQ